MKLVAVIGVTLMAAGAAQAPRLDLSERALVRLASRYVADYERQFAFLVADEEYRQLRLGADGQEVEKRHWRGELFLTYLAADGEWIAVRDVVEVDGKPVTDRADLRQLLLKGDRLRGLANDVAARNARFNIGRTERNFNEPTLPLLLLEEKRLGRVNFDRKSVTREHSTTLATLSFEERDNEPTLVRLREGTTVRARGEFVIDAATGAVRRTTFEIRQPGFELVLETSYGRDERLDMWVPVLFTERYGTGGRFGSRKPSDPLLLAAEEVIRCEATYTNYRRFDVTARIKK
jgi:hypothetical protein